MFVASFIRRALAHQNVLRGAMLPLAIASAVALSAFPSAAIAQTQITAAASETCASLQNNMRYPVAFASATRLEPGAGPLASTKAQAILGGAVSKLDLIRAVQVPGTLTGADLNAETVAPQALRTSVNCTFNGSGSGIVERATFTNAILGSQSVAIARTPFDHEWASVQLRPNNARVLRALARSRARGTGDKIQQLQIINRWVNRNIAFGEDQAVYRRPDYWAPASETFRRGIGDCEDFAIAKMELLSSLGFARSDMRLIIARDLVRNADHAVLVVQLDSGVVMLDNATDRLLDGRLPNDYRPILSFSQNAKWVHGYNVQPAPIVRLASLSPVAAPVMEEASEIIAVTSELELPAISVAWLSAPLALPTLL